MIEAAGTRAGARGRLAAGIAAGWWLVAAAAGAQTNRTELVSVRSDERQAEGRSESASVSFDARFVAFSSNASNLASERDGRVEFDVFVRDRELGTTERLSLGFDGAEPTGDSQAPRIDSAGRIVVFHSTADNLVPDDTNEVADVFAYDRLTGAIERLSFGFDGSEADGASTLPDVSADGRIVVFQSQATNILGGDENGTSDIYRIDRDSGVVQRVSVASDGTIGNGASITAAVSGDGGTVAFASAASNLVDGDTNGIVDIFVHDVATGETERVSISSAGAQADRISFHPSLDFGGRVVAIKSEASNLVPGDTNGVPDVFVFDRDTGLMVRESVDNFGNESNGLSGPPSLSDDGCDLAFPSFANSFIPEDGNGNSDLYVVDRCGRFPERIARASLSLDDEDGPNGDVPDVPHSMSPNGQWVGFSSTASDMVPLDLNNELDVFATGNPLNPPPDDPTPRPTDTPTITPTPTDTATPEDTATPTPTVTPTAPECIEDMDCPTGEVCVDGSCITPTPTPPQCVEDEDCPMGEVCVDGSCVTPTPTPPECVEDEDCPTGEVCVDDECVAATPTTTATPVDDDDDGGGGCSCEVHPGARTNRPADWLALVVPALLLWWRRWCW